MADIIGPQLVPLLVAIAFAAVVFALISPLLSGDRQVDKRVKGINDPRARKLAISQQAENSASRKKSIADTLKDAERGQEKAKLTLRVKLDRAGWEMTPKHFYMMCAIMGVGCAALAQFGMSTPMMGTLVAGFIGAFGLPRWLLNRQIKRRQAKFVGELANGIDIVVRGVKSGLPLNECLTILARESPEPLRSEMREVIEEQRLGVPLAEALERMSHRMPLPEVRFLTIVIAIQQSAGGNLAEALGNLSGVLRDRFRMQLKVKALSAEAKASAMVLASLPPTVMFMVYLTSPEYIMPLFTTTVGKFMLTVGAFWMLTGVLIMRKMINFKF